MTDSQLLLLGLIATVITFVLRQISIWFKYVPSRAVVNVGLFVVALVLAVAWTPLVFPPFPPYVDPSQFVVALLAYLGEILALAAPVVGMATLIYNILYDKVVVPMTNFLRRKGLVK